jgi:hypothetical protein
VYEPTGEHLIASRKAQRTEFQALGSAIQAWADAQVLCDEAAIFRVHDDGREERLPSYEEALGEVERLRADVAGMRAGLLDAAGQSRRLGAVIADPLSALEAAERRLLEAGGWVLAEPDVYGTERWSHPTWQGGRSEGRQVALTIERRRIAAKGGA